LLLLLKIPLNRVIGTDGNLRDRNIFNYDSNYHYLIQQGFSEEEAKGLAWFNKKQNRGKFWGIAGGFWLLYITRGTFAQLSKTYPRFFY